MPDTSRAVRHVASFALALAVVAAVTVAALLPLKYHWSWTGIWKYRDLFTQGWFTTLGIALVALPAATLIGLTSALARRAAWLPVQYAARIYIELTRGTPLLVQIYLYFYIIGQAAGVTNRYILGPLIMALFAGAYMSEIIRGGIEGVARSQLESARAIGLTTPQTYRYIIFPQAIRQILPGLAGQFVNLVKDSSLLSIIALNEFTQSGSNVAAFTASPFETYFLIAAGYLIITLPISLWTQRLEKRVHYET
jgi:polar amino acid transport system permease protein